MSVSIRSQLLLLMLAVLLPGLLAVLLFVGSAYEAQREANTRTLRDTSRALSQVVEQELNKRAAVAQVLAGSGWLDGAPQLSRESLQRFAQQARRALFGMDGWVELRSPEGVLLDTRRDAAAQRTPAASEADNPAALAPRRLFEPLRVGVSPGQAYAAVVEPVQRDGQTLLSVAITVLPSELQRIVDAQQLPQGWIGTVLDNRARVVARHPGGAAQAGREATAEMRARLARGSEGLFDSTSLDGFRTQGFYSTTAQGWSYIVAMPREQFTGLLPIAQVGIAALLVLGLAVAGALWVARRLVQPINMLKAAAAQAHAGHTVSYRPTGIIECDDVARALASATETIQRGRIDLETQVAHAVQRTRSAEQRLSHGQRVEALGRLTGGVAHDFNNLLGVISNSAHLIERHAAAHELQLPLGGIRRAVAVGSELVQHLLRFAGRRPLQPQAIELGPYLQSMRELLGSVLGQHIAVSARVAADTQAVRVDVGELELALINLALNARDAMPSGGELRLQARNATPDESEGLAGPAGCGYVHISVGDDGQGVEEEVAARAFEPFFTTQPVGRGTGLGLSQVLGFCVQAGGTARLGSTPGLGTTVCLLLPAAPRTGAAAAPPRAQVDTATAAAAALAGARVLLVEDNEALAQVSAALLRSHGLQVQHAAHAAEALQRLTPPHDFDLVFSDVIMPGEIDGLMLARRLRREQPGLPVVLTSGYSDTAAQAADFKVLRKPCSEDELLQALLQALVQTLGAKPPRAAGAAQAR